MSVVFIANYFFSGYDVSVDNKMFLIIDFVNLKIKSTQFFRCVHKDRVYVCILIR
jgi:hypothetical protein